MAEQSEFALCEYFSYYYYVMDKVCVCLQTWVNKVILLFIINIILILLLLFNGQAVWKFTDMGEQSGFVLYKYFG